VPVHRPGLLHPHSRQGLQLLEVVVRLVDPRRIIPIVLLFYALASDLAKGVTQKLPKYSWASGFNSFGLLR
jgi:hypothetical protein